MQSIIPEIELKSSPSIKTRVMQPRKKTMRRVIKLSSQKTNWNLLWIFLGSVPIVAIIDKHILIMLEVCRFILVGALKEEWIFRKYTLVKVYWSFKFNKYLIRKLVLKYSKEIWRAVGSSIICIALLILWNWNLFSERWIFKKLLVNAWMW